MINNLKMYTVGDLQENCYSFTDESTGKMAVVDPGADSDELDKEINKCGGKLAYILLTHGHYDHIGNAQKLRKKFGGEICISEVDAPLLKDNSLNLSAPFGIPLKPFDADRVLSDGDIIMLGESKIEFILTPGHTDGSGCYAVDNHIFTGDTLFYNSIGRTDFPTGHFYKLVRSLRKLDDLDGDRILMPGHGVMTTLDRERQGNRYMNGGV